MRKLWVDELQPELARLSTRGRRAIVEGSGHQIPIEQPRAVVEAVREVVDASRPP
jgi:pimeloyl-ACP methyl ester carboxylesterase